MPETQNIKLSKDNNDVYGFSRFCFSGEENILHGVWKRTLQISVGGDSGIREAIISVNEADVIKLPDKGDEKLTAWPGFSIMNRGDMTAPMKFLSERAGWNQTIEDLKAFAGMDSRGIFLAALEKSGTPIPLGTGAVFPVGRDLSWIGMILVHPEVRRQGLARAIMYECIAHARLHQKNTIVGLDATPLGKQVYDDLGFKDSYTIWRSSVSTSIPLKNHPDIAVSQESNILDCHDFLFQKAYSHRIPVLQVLAGLPEGNLWLARKGDVICGLALSRPGRLRPFVGPLLADSPEIAHLLLSNMLHSLKKNGHSEVFMDIPERHFNQPSKKTATNAQIELIPPTGFVLDIPALPLRPLIRMYQLVDKNDQYQNIKMSKHKWSEIVAMSVKSCPSTLDYIHTETTILLPHLYATSGPEIG